MKNKSMARDNKCKRINNVIAAKKIKCSCGGISIDKFRGEYICEKCLNPEYETEISERKFSAIGQVE